MKFHQKNIHFVTIFQWYTQEDQLEHMKMNWEQLAEKFAYVATFSMTGVLDK